MEKKNNYYYHLVKGKNNLIENFGWYYDFANKLYDFQNKEIHYKEVVEQGRKKDFKGVELALYKDIDLEENSVLVQSVYNIFKDEKFKEKNEETKTKLKERFSKEWDEILSDVEQHKDNPFNEELVQKYVVLKELPEKEMREKIKKMSNEENDALNEYALYLTDKEIYEDIMKDARNWVCDANKEFDFDKEVKNSYVKKAMNLALEKGLYIEYTSEGEPILDSDDWKDLTRWQLRINITPKDKLKNIVFVCNSRIMYEYSNINIVGKYVKEEIEKGMFRKSTINNLLSNSGGQFKLNEKGMIEELGSTPIDNLQVDIDEYEDMEYENELNEENRILN